MSAGGTPAAVAVWGWVPRTLVTLTIRCTSSTAAPRPIRTCFEPSRASEYACASSTPLLTLIFNVALAGHKLDVIASDGYPVQPVSADSLQISMGGGHMTRSSKCRYGVFAFAAEPLASRVRREPSCGQARDLSPSIRSSERVGAGSAHPRRAGSCRWVRTGRRSR